MKKTMFFLAALFTALSAIHPLPFNSRLSEEERAVLGRGEVLIRNIDYARYMSIEGENPGIKKLRDSVSATKPNYLAEIIKVEPYEGNEDLPKKIRSALENIEEYAGIPYWSERHQRYYDLYTTAEILSAETREGGLEFFRAKLFMEPFGDIYCPIEIEDSDDYLFYEQTNTNPLKFEGITCVNPYCMKSTILLFRDGENWILYGAGGVRAPRIPFLTHRIETSFINRIKTFCNFIFSKLEEE